MKKFLMISSCLMLIMSFSMLGYKVVSANEELDEIKDWILEQADQEAYLTPYGYTLDNPNIILDPYDISPLTALILFETDEEVEVTLTVKGKDANSTYTNKFKKETKHYLPVYGLYPNTKNEVIIKCGDQTKTYTITTNNIPEDLKTSSVTNNTNKLTFITTDKYVYAIDNNDDLRWYLTKLYSNQITALDNNNFLLATNTINANKKPTSLIEIDLFGKIYKQYELENNQYKDHTSNLDSIFILSENLIEIDKQSGIILNKYNLNNSYNHISYNEKNKELTLTNTEESLIINTTTKEQTTSSLTAQTKESTIQNSLTTTLYQDNSHYRLTKGIKFDSTIKTKESSENIFLINYKKPDKTYQKYNIKFKKTSSNLQIDIKLDTSDEVYLILDKFLDKRVYDIKEEHTIINKESLSGKYSLYIKINDTIYKTNTYVKF